MARAASKNHYAFSSLFKKLRLLSGFSTLNEFGNALADKGLVLENSIFSHWQNGTRVPRDRTLILKMISIFLEKNALQEASEANLFLESCNQGYLSDDESRKLFGNYSIPSSFERVKKIQALETLVKYYRSLLQPVEKKNAHYYKIIDQENSAIFSLLDELIEQKLYKELFAIWEYFGDYLWDRRKWKRYEIYLKKITEISKILNREENYKNYSIERQLWSIYWNDLVFQSKKVKQLAYYKKNSRGLEKHRYYSLLVNERGKGNKKFYTLSTIFLFLFFLSFGVVISIWNIDGFWRALFASTYFIIAVWGGLIGLNLSRQWGGVKSHLGQSILAFSIGLLLQSFGQVFYSYNLYILKAEVVYPSIGDIGYFGSIFFYFWGLLMLSKASGIFFAIKKSYFKFSVVFIPLTLLIFSYALFLHDHQFEWSTPLTVFLDFFSPLGHAVNVSFALVAYFLYGKVLGGIWKSKVTLILLSIGMQYISDFSFIYLYTKGLWIVGGINDLSYLFSYFLLSISLTLMKKN